MTHAVRARIVTFCLTVLSTAIAFNLFPHAAFAQTPSFSAHSFSSAAGNTLTLHGDFNNDGYEDLIIGTRVYLSKGDGNYRSPLTFNLPNGASYASALVGDFNGDGKLDLVVATFLANGTVGYSTYLGNGDGTFRAPINQAVEYLYPAMAAADVNHDGKLDLLVITAHSAASLQVLFGNGDGTFAPGPIYGGTLMYEVDTILTGDFDGDGNVDVAVVWSVGPPADGPAGGGGTQFEVLSGDGTGNFALTYGFYCCGYYFSLNAADVNGDGISDLVSPTEDLAQNAEPNLTVFYGAPNRAMQFVQIPTERCAASNFTNPIAVADFNGDHIPDIAFSDAECSGGNATRITILPGKGNNQFGFDTAVYSATSIFPSVIALRGDRDTKADLVFTTPTTSNTPIITLLNTSSGNFPTCAPPNASAGISVCSPAGGSAASPVNFAIGAASSVPLRKVELWSDGKKLLEQFAGAFSNYAFLNASVPLAAGSHKITTFGVGWDDSLQSKTFTLNVSASSCSAPSSAGVHICSPASGSSVSSPVVVQATAKVTGTIASTQLWVDGVKKYSVASSALKTSIPLAAGSHRFAVIAVNTAGTKWESTVNATVK